MRTDVKEITAKAQSKGKDPVIEDPDFCAKKSDLQKNKTCNRMITQLAYSQYTQAVKRTCNRMITQLAYSQYTQAVKRRCFKDNVDLKIVNPAYTSREAKETVCNEPGMSIHPGAAGMIARRGLGLF